MSSATTFALIFITIASVAIYHRSQSRHVGRHLPLPPGPPPFPFIGNIHQLPLKNSYISFNEWAKKYGPVISFRTFGRQFIVLNDIKSALNLYEKRSLTYATKPRLVMAGELVGKEKTSMVFAKYGTLLRECRKLCRGWMSKDAIHKSWRSQEIASYRLLESLLKNPSDFSQHIRTQAATVLLHLLYGINCLPENDPYIELSERVSAVTSLAMRPGHWLCDSFPILARVPAWIPGAYFKHWAENAKRLTNELIFTTYYTVRNQVLNGTATRSWVSEAIYDDDGKIKTGEMEYNLIVAAGTLYASGIDTTVGAIRTFILMMAQNPEVQKKAQEEIDNVVGEQRIPNMTDCDALPYLNCVIKEVLRVACVAPIMPHSLDVDDIYEGYIIPKGSWVMVNSWAIFNDSNIYPNPTKFDPGRYYPSPSGELQMDPETLCFGLGRRSCVGMHFARSLLFLNMAHILFTFNITPRNGCDPPEVIFEFGHLRAPAPFDCKILPRSSDRVHLVQQVIGMTKGEQ